MSNITVGVNERPPLLKWIPLSFQHVFAMFGATVLVPMLTGLSPSAALFTAGSGTLIYIAITGAKVPAFLGSSFAFIPAIIGVGAVYGISYALGGAVVAGIFYALIALLIRQVGTGWLDRVLPPVVIGSVIIVIGLNLAPTAMGMAMNNPAGEYSLVTLSIAGFTLMVAIISTIFLKGFFNVIPILIGLVSGYLFTLIMGTFIPAYHVIDFTVIKEAAWFNWPTFAVPKFGVMASLTFVIVSLATICEHLGDIMVTSRVVGVDFYKKPGLHRTLLGDGVATAWAAFWVALLILPMVKTLALWPLPVFILYGLLAVRLLSPCFFRLSPKLVQLFKRFQPPSWVVFPCFCLES